MPIPSADDRKMEAIPFQEPAGPSKAYAPLLLERFRCSPVSNCLALQVEEHGAVGSLLPHFRMLLRHGPTVRSAGFSVYAALCRSLLIRLCVPAA
jgi:hypothetical protein